MSIVSFRDLAPPSSGDIPVSDPDRLADLERKHALVTDYLKSQKLDAILLQNPGNFSWFTSGGDCSRGVGAFSSRGGLRFFFTAPVWKPRDDLLDRALVKLDTALALKPLSQLATREIRIGLFEGQQVCDDGRRTLGRTFATALLVEQARHPGLAEGLLKIVEALATVAEHLCRLTDRQAIDLVTSEHLRLSHFHDPLVILLQNLRYL